MANLNEKKPLEASHNHTSFHDEQHESFISDDNLFLMCLVFVEILGCILVALSFSWMLQIGGFGLETKTIFNYHPPLMTLAMIFLNANGS